MTLAPQTDKKITSHLNKKLIITKTTPNQNTKNFSYFSLRKMPFKINCSSAMMLLTGIAMTN